MEIVALRTCDEIEVLLSDALGRPRSIRKLPSLEINDEILGRWVAWPSTLARPATTMGEGGKMSISSPHVLDSAPVYGAVNTAHDKIEDDREDDGSSSSEVSDESPDIGQPSHRLVKDKCTSNLGSHHT